MYQNWINYTNKCKISLPQSRSGFNMKKVTSKTMMPNLKRQTDQIRLSEDNYLPEEDVG